MSLKKTIVRLYHFQGTQESTNWIIWADKNPLPAPSIIPSFDENFAFPVGAYVLHENKVWRANRTIFKGQFNKNNWTEVDLMTAYVSSHDAKRDYVEDEFVIDDNDDILKTKWNINAKPFDANDWSVVQTGTQIDTGTIYMESVGNETERRIISGQFIKLGGTPEVYDPVAGLGKIETYFAENNPGSWFKFVDRSKVWADIPGFQQIFPGQKVARVNSVLGDANLLQADPAFQPTYYEDDLGNGYIVFSGEEHFVLEKRDVLAPVELVFGIPGTGAFTASVSASPEETMIVGPTAPNSEKKWTLSEIGVFNKELTETETKTFRDVIHLSAIGEYYSSVVTSMRHWFDGDVDFNQDISDWDMYGKQDLSYMFYNAVSFNQPLEDWNLERVTDISYMFANAESFNQPINAWDFANLLYAEMTFSGAIVFNQDLDTWDMFGVKSTAGMFQDAKAFNGKLNGWSLALTENVSAMFDGANSFNQPIDSFKLSKVTKINDMFNGAWAFNQPLIEWDLSDVTDLSGMFQDAFVFDQDITYFDVSNVKSFMETFANATAFNQPIGVWKTLSAVNFFHMFDGASSFNQPLAEWQTDNVGNMTGMFANTIFNQDISPWCVSRIATKPTDFDANGDVTWGTSPQLQPQWGDVCLKFLVHAYFDASIKETLFQDVNGLIPVVEPGDKVLRWNDLGANKYHAIANRSHAPTYRQDVNGVGYLEFNNDEFMTFNDTGLAYDSWETIPGIGSIGLVDTNTVIGPQTEGQQKRYIGQFVCVPQGYTAEDLEVITGFTSNGVSKYQNGTVTDLRYYFQNIIDFNSELVIDWDVSLVENFEGMFQGAKIFNQDISAWVMDSATNTSAMFKDAVVFDQNVGNWNMPNVLTTAQMFQGASNFNHSLVWNTVNTKDMSYMFSGASSLSALITLDYSEVEDTSYMFQNASNFNSVINGPAPKLITAKGMFQNAVRFNKTLDQFIGPSVTDISFMFDGALSYNSPFLNWDVSNITTLEATFRKASVFDQPIDAWDVGKVVTMKETFRNAKDFNQPLNSWNTSSVVIMTSMFTDATSFNQEIDDWDMRRVQYLDYMFQGAAVFNSPLQRWKTESALTFKGMFQSAVLFNQDISNWDTGTVLDFDNMFFNASVFNQDISPWCVKQIAPPGPHNFSFGAPLIADWHPIWGARCLAELGDLWYDSSDITKVFTDLSMTTHPAPGDKVAVLLDKGNLGINAIQEDEALRPIYHEDSEGYGYLEFPSGTKLVASGLTGTGVWVNNIPSVGGWGDYIVVPSETFEIGFESNEMPSASRKLGQVMVYFNAPSDSDLLVLDKAVNRWARLYEDGLVTDISAALEGNADFDWDISQWNMSRVTHANFLLAGCENFNVDINSWDVGSLLEAKGMFKDCSIFNQELSSWNVSSLLHADYMFQNAIDFNGNINNWQTTSLLSMQGMFRRARSFNQNIASWITTTVTNMAEAFQGAIAFNHDLPWDTSAVTTMRAMFKDTQAFNGILSSWDVSSVTDFSEMFWSAAVFNRDLNAWNTVSATNMANMFRDAGVFDRPLNNWLVNNVVDFTGMFYGASEFNGDIGTWVFDASDIVMDEMFRDAYKFNNDITGWNTTNVTSMMQMFRDAFIFNRTLVLWCVKNVMPEEAAFFGLNSDMSDEQLPLFGEPCVGEYLAGYYDASLINTLGTDLAGLVRPMPGDKVAYVGDISGKDNHAIQSDVSLRPEYQEDENGRGYLIFRDGQHLLASGISGVSRNWVAICGRGVPEWTDQTNNPAKIGIKEAGGADKVWYWGAEAISTDPANTATEFGYIQNAIQLRADSYPSDLQLIITNLLAEETHLSGGMRNFRISNIGSLKAVFRNCVNFNEDLSGWDTSSIVETDELFYGCSSLDQDLSRWVMSNVLSARAMFQGASSFNSDLSGWDVSRIRDFSYMFYGCSSFTSNLNTWTIRNDTDVNMRAMFASATAFNSPLDNWDTRWVTNMAEMFWGAMSFNQDIGNWNTIRVSTMNSMFRAAIAFDQDIGSWRVGSVLNMGRMFQDATTFNQDISRWCVSQITATPTDFDADSGFAGQLAKQPFWGGFCFAERAEFYHSGQDKDFMFQDAAGTIPVTTPGDPIGFVTDLTGNGRHLIQTNNGARPVYREDALGNGMIEFGPTQDLILDYDGRADHIISVAGRGKIQFTSQDFQSGKSIKRYFTPGNYGYHRLGVMAGVATGMSASDKAIANNTLQARGVQYDASAQPSMAEFFRANVNLSNNDIIAWDMSDVTSLAGIFEGCINFNMNVNGWNTGSVTNMSRVFVDCQVFNQPLNNWNTVNVDNFSYMFQNANAFNQNINNWNVSSAELFRYMFAKASTFNKPLNNWNTANMTLAEFMFLDAANFNQNISTWNMSSVTSVRGMFYGASAFNNGAVSMANWNLGQCTNFTEMFFEASDFNQIVDNWVFYTGASAVNMKSMFERARSFNRSLLTWNTTSVTNMSRMFKEASLFDNGGVDLLEANGAWTMTNVTDMSFMFQDARRFNRHIYDWNTAKVTTMQGLFWSPNAVSTFNKPLTNWITSNVANMSAMFSGASAFDQDVSGLDVSGVTDMYAMFENALVFNNGNAETLENWDVSNVVAMDRMFSNAVEFNRILCRWNVANVTNMEGMFAGAVKYNQFLRGWNVKHITSEPTDFGAPNLINRPNWGDDPDPCRSDCSRTLIESGAESIFLGFESSWMYQDEAMTTPVTADGQRVRALEDSSGNGHNVTWSNASEAPIYRIDGANGYLEFGPGTTFPIEGTGNKHVAFDIIGVGGTYKTMTAPVDLFDNARTGTYLVASIVVAPAATNGQSIVTAQRSCAPAYSVETTSLEYMFADTYALGNIVGWNLGSVTNVEGMFESNVGFDQNISGWNTANVTNFNKLFRNASAFNQDISGWTTTSALTMDEMFLGATLFNCGETGGDSGRPMGWNTANVTSMIRTFAAAENFNQDIGSWNTASVTSMRGLFLGAGLFNQPIGSWNTALVEDMAFTFSNALSFNQNIGNWNVSAVTTMESMFEHADAFDRELNTWVTTSLTNTASMFKEAGVFNRPLDAWDMSKVITTAHMFEQAIAFNQDLNTWTTSNVSTMEAMFAQASSFQGNIGGWDTASVTNMSFMFDRASRFNSDISNWAVSSVTNMNSMFKDTDSFDVAIGGWDVASVVDFGSVFESATSFNKRISCWNTVSATNMDRMFYAASNFNHPLSGWCVSNITSEPTDFKTGANAAWANNTTSQPNWGTCTPGGVTGQNVLASFNPLDITTLFQDELRTIPVTAPGDPVKSIADISGNNNHALLEGTAFYQEDTNGNGFIALSVTFFPNFALAKFYVPTLTQEVDISFVVPSVGDTYLSRDADVNGAALVHGAYEYSFGPVVYTASGSGNTVTGYECLSYVPGTVTSLRGLFAVDYTFNRNLNHWDTSHIEVMHSVFDSAALFNNGDAPGESNTPLTWDTSSVTNMESLFRSAESFNQPLPWNVGNVVNFENTFQDALLFNQNIGNWNTSSADAMSYMFSGAETFNQDINGWNVSNVVDFQYMFEGAIVFNQNLNNWNTGSADSMYGMFQDAVAFNGDITTWDVSNVTELSEMFKNAVSFNQNLNGWNTASFEYIYGMFQGASSFNQPLNNWNVENVYSMQYVFADTDSFNQDLNDWTLTSAQNLEYMFQNAIAFNNGNVEEWVWDITNAFTAIGMFEGATNFNASIGKWNVKGIGSMSSMFKDAVNFNKPISCWDVSETIGMEDMFNGAAAYNQNLSGWCVDNLGSKPSNFDLNSGFESDVLKQPQWGECPVGFNPGGVAKGQFYIADGQGVYQDASRTIPAVADGDPVLGLEDRTGAGNHGVIEGSAKYRIDAAGLGYLELTPNSSIRVPTITDVTDISFIVPGIGFAAIAVDGDESGIQYGNKPTTVYVSQFVLGDEGTLSDETNLGCTFHPQDTVDTVAYLFQNERKIYSSLSAWKTANITNMTSMFEGVREWSNADLSSWETGSVVDMSRMFSGCRQFNSDISSWDVSSVNNIEEMFSECEIFDQDLSNWAISGITSLYGVFRGAQAFNSDISGWITNGVTNMSETFAGARLFDQPLNTWDVSSVTTFTGMFAGAERFNQSLSSWTTTAAVEMDFMFFGALGFNSAGTTLDFDLKGVTTTKGMFQNAGTFNLDISTWDMSTVEDPSYMFYNALQFNQPIGEWNLASAVTTAHMFEGAQSFNDGNPAGLNTSIIDFGLVNNLTSEYTFAGCNSFNSRIGTWSIDGGSAKGMFKDCPLFNTSISDIDLTTTVDTSEMFMNCTQFNNGLAPTANVGTITVNAAAVETSASMFENCQSFNGRLNAFNTANTLRNTSRMFAGCSSMNQPVFLMNMQGVVDASYMFSGCDVFNNGNDLSANTFFTNTIENAAGMFEFCPALTSPDLSQWNTVSATDMSNMFSGCSLFEGNVEFFDVGSVTNFDGMFRNAARMNSEIGCWNTINATSMDNMFDGATNFVGNLTGWCVSGISSAPTDFNKDSQITGLPQWGTCPATSVGGNNVLANLDFTNPATLYQDLAMTSPVTAPGQTVKVIEDTTGNGYHGIVEGIAIARQDASGLYMVELAANAAIKTTGLIQEVDVGFNIPSIGSTYVSHPADAGGFYFWGKPETQTFGGSLLIVEGGSGDSIGGYACLRYQDKHTTTLAYLFEGERTFNQDIGTWDVSTITNFDHMFDGAWIFNESIENWDLSSATSVEYMFKDASAFDQNVNNWDFTNVTSVKGMFENATSFNNGISTELNLTNTSNVTDFSFMFAGASSFNTLCTMDFSSATTFESMFENAGSYNQSCGWANTTGVTTTKAMFKGATSFNAAVSFDFSSVSNADQMFMDAWSFNQDLLINTTSLVSAREMFRNATVFNANIDDWNVFMLQDATGMFQGTPEFNRDISRWTTDNLMYLSNMFAQTTSFNQDISGWNTFNFEDTSYMFRDAFAFNQDISGWIVDYVTNLDGMFRGTQAFNQDISGWLFNTSLTSMNEMFMDAAVFNQNLGDWYVGDITSMNSMFRGARVFNSPLSDWDVSSVTDFRAMFREATAFNQNIKCWDVSSATQMDDMFRLASSFDQNLSGWCVGNNIASEPAGFDAGSPINAVGKGPEWGVACSPGTGLGATNTLAIFDVTSMANLYQDAARTIPVTAAGQTVLGIEDTSGNNNHAEITGTVYYEENSMGVGYLKLMGASQVVMPTLTQAVDIGFLIPGTGDAYVSHAADATGAKYWGKATETVVGGILVTDSGFGGTISGFDCIGHDEKVFNSLDMLFRNEATFNADIAGWNLTGITSLRQTFQDAVTFDQDISGWDVGSVTDMYRTFESASAFNQNVGGWDVSLVTNFDGTFENAIAFNNGDAAGTSNTPFTWTPAMPNTSISQMFKNATVFNQSVSTLVNANVTTLFMAFKDCPAFNQDISTWDTASVTNMSNTFDGCLTFNNGSAPGVSDNALAWDTAACNTFSRMFFNCEAFNQPMPNWVIGQIATQMFNQADVFNQDLNSWNTVSTTDIQGMFYGASAFNNGEAAGSSTNPLNWEAALVESHQSLFRDAVAFNQPLPNLNTANSTNMAYMFKGTSFNQPVAHLSTALVTTTKGMFEENNVFNQDLSTWNVTCVENFSRMFYNASSFNSVIQCWNVSAGLDMTAMFYGAAAFDQDISGWCVGNNIATRPASFAIGSPIEAGPKEPQWGVTCSPGGLAAQNVLASFDPRMMTTLYQDELRTTPITGPGQPIKGIEDLSGNGNHAVVQGFGSVRFRLDADGNGYLDIDSDTKIVIPTLTQAVDVAFVIPGVAWAWEAIPAIATGTEYWGKGAIASRGPIVVTDSGFGNTVSNYGCVNYAAETTSSIAYTFADAPAFGTDYASWDMTAVTNAESVFENTAINDPAIAVWDTSGFTKMKEMFRGCSAFNVDISGWIVSDCVDFDGIFRDCSSFNQPVGNWVLNTSEPIRFSGAFRNADVFNQDLSNWATIKAKTAYYMFSRALAFNNGEAAGLSNTPFLMDFSECTDMNSIFRDCSSFNQPVSEWDVSNQSGLDGLFAGCPLFNQDISAWNPASAVSMDSMFNGATVFNNGSAPGVADKPIPWFTPALKNTRAMFFNAKSFNQAMPNFTWIANSTTQTSSMFLGAELFNQDISTWDLSNVRYASGMFTNAFAFNNGSAPGVADNPLDINFQQVSNYDAMFSGCESFNQDLPWNMTSATSLSQMFETNSSGVQCAFNRPLDHWDVSNVTDFSGMFRSNVNFNQPLNTWNVRAAMDMDEMFRLCSAFSQDLSMWCTPNITSEPVDFSVTSGMTPAQQPVWANMGSC